MAETSSLLNCRTGNRTTSSNLVASAVRVAKTYDGAIAQLVEQRTENPCVPGSIPGGTTKKKRGIATQQRVVPLFFISPSYPLSFPSMSTSSTASAPARAPRSSNIELLRIVAMLFIMFLHLNRENAGLPSITIIEEQPIYAVLWSWLRMINLTGVDVFILISGYFAIRPRVNSVISLFFQGIFYSVGMYAFWVLTKQADFSLGELSMHLKPMKVYWFFGSYVWLVLLAPVLNRYVESATKREFGLFLVVYYFFACGMEWWMSASSELQRGYSVLAFIGLYLLARYVRLHGGRWCELAPRYDLLIFLGSTALSALLALVLFWGMGRPLVGDDPLVDRLVSYTSPLCIVASLSLLLFFSKIKLGHIRWINWLAASSFSVYLLHEEYLTRGRYLALANCIGQHYAVLVAILLLVALVLGVYLAATLIDQVRQLLWRRLFSPLLDRIEGALSNRLNS